MHKQVRRWVRHAKRQRWGVRERSRHVQFLPPDKDRGIVTVSRTPSDPRALDNARADLARAGLKGV